MSLPKMKVLLRLKTLKEEQALRALQAKRREVADGEAALDRSRQAAAASAATLSSREDAIYDAILGRVLSLDDLDDTRGAVVRLEQDHARLTDAVDRSAHILARLNTELDASATAHRASLRVKDKYTTLTVSLADAVAEEAARAEENEVEELFATPRKAPQ
jgi:hypothetical protein